MSRWRAYLEICHPYFLKYKTLIKRSHIVQLTVVLYNIESFDDAIVYNIEKKRVVIIPTFIWASEPILCIADVIIAKFSMIHYAAFFG